MGELPKRNQALIALVDQLSLSVGWEIDPEWGRKTVSFGLNILFREVYNTTYSTQYIICNF